MRYAEVLEAAAATALQKRKRARDQLAAADRKRADAARKYQDELQASRSAAEQAKAKMRALKVGETAAAPKLQDLLERPRSYPLRDRAGSILGWIEAVGRLLQAKDRNGSILGWYDPRTNQTRDKTGSIVGDGDFLSALVVTKGRL